MIKLTSKPNTDPPSSSYLKGSLHDNDGSGNGTPVNKLVYNDMHLFFEKLMQLGGITANNLPDNDDNGYQLIQAFQEAVLIAGGPLFSVLSKSLIGDEAAILGLIDPYSLLGLRWNAGATVLSAGYIFYVERLYFCAGFTGTISDTAVFTQTGPHVMTVTDAASGSGLFDYSELRHHQIPRGTYTPTLGIDGGTGTFTASIKNGQYHVTKDFVYITMYLAGIGITGAPNELTVSLPPDVPHIGNIQSIGVANFYDGSVDSSKALIFPSSSGSEKIGIVPTIFGVGTFSTTSSGVCLFSIVLQRGL